jgi:HK97 family phage portal protein
MLLDGELLARASTAPLSTFDSPFGSFVGALGSGTGFSPRMVNQVWAAARCLQLNSQQVAAMPLRFFGRYEPAWVSSPDPAWFPNGISSAAFAAIYNLYAWGDAFLYITSRYANGLPSAWTVLNSETVSVKVAGGRRTYRAGNTEINPNDVVQIQRNPTGALRGTPALSAFGSHMLSAVASADLARTINDGGIPNAVLKAKTKLTAEQAEAIQNQWVERTALRRGAPAVLPEGLDFETLSYSPADLLLVDVQQFDARVIAAAFGVPPFMLNVPMDGGLTYQSPAMLFEVWWRSELRPMSKVLADALTANMLPRGSWVEFDARDLLAPSFNELVTAWKDILEFGGGTIDEFRAAVLRLPPQSEQEAVMDQLVPPTAATPANASADTSNVATLRPAQEGTSL